MLNRKGYEGYMSACFLVIVKGFANLEGSILSNGRLAYGADPNRITTAHARERSSDLALFRFGIANLGNRYLIFPALENLVIALLRGGWTEGSGELFAGDKTMKFRAPPILGNIRQNVFDHAL
ncbi:hypothetical protein FIU95_21780 (plasmid) [Microbulbifer sp. THAF38]|nr:hypothetical protein FIU95_21780 [Microbulbifer sp. THAF38]